MQSKIPTVIVRDFSKEDANEVNRIAVAAFEQYSNQYSDWATLKSRIATTSRLATEMMMFIATKDDMILGCVAYTPPHGPRPDFFDIEPAIIRMLVVDPAQRGHGAGGLLTQRCIDQARKENVKRIHLHTSEAMIVARDMYMRRGFRYIRPAPDVFGLSQYGIYELEL